MMSQLTHKHLVLTYGICVCGDESKCSQRCYAKSVNATESFNSWVFCFRHHGAGICKVWIFGYLPEEEQELYISQHLVEAGGGQAARLGHAVFGKNR